MELCDTKIVFVINTLDVGGAGKILRFVANSCVNNFKEVEIISFFNAEKKNGLNSQINDYCLDIKMQGIAWRATLLSKLRKKIRESKPDIVCAFISDVASMTRIATLGMNIVFVSAERGDPYTLPRKWIPIVKWAYSRSDYCIFQLAKARDFFGDRVAKKSFVIPNPYTSKVSIYEKPLGKKKTIISVGRLEDQKGFDVLIKAFAKVYKKHADYKLIIYGDGAKRSELEELICDYDLKSCVELPGTIYNVLDTIKDQGIFVLPSRFEGIPNTLIEAMSVGVPTISTDCTPGGPDFLTNHGERGMLVPVNDDEALSEAIIKMIEDDQLQREYSQKGLEILKELEPDRIEKQWRLVFESIIVTTQSCLV